VEPATESPAAVVLLQLPPERLERLCAKKVIDRIKDKLLGGFREEVQRSSLPVLGFSECPPSGVD